MIPRIKACSEYANTTTEINRLRPIFAVLYGRVRRPRPRCDALSADSTVHNVCPGVCGAEIGLGRKQDAVVKAGLIRAEAFEVIEWREVLGGIGEGDEFAVDGVPVSEGLGVGGVWGHVGGVAGLCGGIGERIGGAVGEDGFLGHFEGWVCAEVVESAPDGGGLDIDGVVAEAVMVWKAALQGAVDEQGYDWAGAVIADCVLPRGFLGFHTGTLRVLSVASMELRRRSWAMKSTLWKSGWKISSRWKQASVIGGRAKSRHPRKSPRTASRKRPSEA